LFDNVKGMIDEHKKREKEKVRRMKQIEVNFSKSMGDLNYVKINLKEKVNQCIKSIHNLSDSHN